MEEIFTTSVELEPEIGGGAKVTINVPEKYNSTNRGTENKIRNVQ